jgi:uncharacterized protein (DUF302 family)
MWSQLASSVHWGGLSHLSEQRPRGHAKKAIQFESGHPLTAERMTRHRLAAGLYAPLRIVLYEEEQGRAVFEYDLPTSLFSQFGDERVAKTGRELDEELKEVLMTAAG